MAKFQTLQDNFNTNTRDSSKWNQFASGSTSISQNNGLLLIAMPTNANSSSYAFYDSVNAFSLVDSYAYVQIVQIYNTSTTADMVYRIELDATRWIRWVIEENIIYAQYRNGGGQTTLYSVAFSYTTHRYIRLRETGGTVYWETSPDAITWTTRATLATPTFVSSNDLYLYLEGSCYENVTNAGTCAFDDLNIALKPASLLKDDFNGNALDTTRWQQLYASSAGGSTLTVSDSKARFDMSTSVGAVLYYRSLDNYFLNGSEIIFRLPSNFAVNDYTNMYLGLDLPDASYMGACFTVQASVMKIFALSFSGDGAVVNFNPSSTPYVRVRLASSILYVDVSSNGATWSNVSQTSATVPGLAKVLMFGSGIGSGAPSAVLEIESVNIKPNNNFPMYF